MLFNSHIFLFLFLPLSLVLYWMINYRYGTKESITALTLASLVFYGYWNPPYVLLMLASILFNFALGRFQSRAGGGNKPLLLVGIVVNLGVLCYYKYFSFAATTLQSLTGVEWTVSAIILPLAISFFTFTQIAYLVDVYRGIGRSYEFQEYCFFVLFFPHLIAGPIVRHYEIIPQIDKRKMRFQLDALAAGVTMLTLGLAKKVLLADTVAPSTSEIFAAVNRGAHPDLALSWIGALGYTCQIYFDFSGYSDMAIGLGLMFGVRLPLNFNSPYKSESIVDFWRRWHISLSRFLKDYLYIPLGGGRVGKPRKYFNLMTTMLLGGLWHGAGWTFVIWGGLHGIYLVINHGWSALTLNARWADSRVARSFYRVTTFLAVVVAWVLFRAESLPGALRMLQGMAGGNAVILPTALAPFLEGYTPNWISFGTLGVSMRVPLLIAFMLAIAFLAPNTQEIMHRAEPALESVSSRTRFAWALRPYWAFGVGVVLALVLGSLGRVSEFLYFQF